MKLPDAKDLNYWKTGKKLSPDVWVNKACDEITRAGGTVFRCLPSAMERGRMAHVIDFSLNGDDFKVIWPVLVHDPADAKAAIRQAATMLYHDVKAKCVAARVFGARWAFTAELCLPDGRTAGQLSVPELLDILPKVALLTDSRGTEAEED